MGKEIILKIYREYYEHKIPFLAAAISFYAMLTILPLTLFGFSFLGFILQSEEIQKNVLIFVKNQIPLIYNFAESNIKAVIAGRQSIGILGLAALLWVSTSIFSAIEFALNNIYHIKQPKHFIIHKLTAFLIIIIFAVLFISSFSLSLYITNISNLINFFPSISQSLILFTNKVFTYLLALFLTVSIFLLIYYLVPNKKMKFKNVISGAIIAGFIWESTKYIFLWYLDNFTVLEKLYGSLWILIVLLIWIFTSSQILLFGALVNKIFFPQKRVD